MTKHTRIYSKCFQGIAVCLVLAACLVFSTQVANAAGVEVSGNTINGLTAESTYVSGSGGVAATNNVGISSVSDNQEPQTLNVDVSNAAGASTSNAGIATSTGAASLEAKPSSGEATFTSSTSPNASSNEVSGAQTGTEADTSESAQKGDKTAVQSDSNNNVTTNETPLGSKTQTGSTSTKTTPLPYVQVEEGAYDIISSAGLVIDIDSCSTESGANAQVWGSAETANQRFVISTAGKDDNNNTYYYITNVCSDKVLACADGSIGAGANVCQTDNTSDASQQWYFRQFTSASGDKSYIITNVKSGFALHVAGNATENGSNVNVVGLNGAAAQRWNLRRWQATIESGAYVIASSLDQNKVLDVKDASFNDGASVQLYSSNGTLAQAFGISEYGNTGYYTITNYQSGKKLDIPGGLHDAGLGIWQWSSVGTAAQLWQVNANDDGTYTILSALTGQALDVPSGNTSDGTQVQQWYQNGAAAQKFVLNSTNPGFYGGIVRIVSGVNSNLVFDVPDSSTNEQEGIELYDSLDSWAQKVEIVADGELGYIIRFGNSGMVLTGEKNGQVTQRTYSGYEYYQHWDIEPTADGHFSITVHHTNVGIGAKSGAYATSRLSLINLNTSNGTTGWHFANVELFQTGLYAISSSADGRKFLDIEGSSCLYGGNVQLYSGNNSNAQTFYVENRGNNVYYIVNYWSTLALDLPDGNAYAGNNIRQWGQNGSSAQLWNASIGTDGVLFKSNVNNSFALSATGTWDGANVQLEWADVNNWCQQFHLYTTFVQQYASFDARIQVLDNNGGDGLNVFKSLKSLSSGTWDWLWDAIDCYHRDGQDVGFIMMDLNSGAGVYYNSYNEFYSASTIKGPYVTAVNKYFPDSLAGWQDVMDQIISVSSNEAYAELRAAYGDGPMIDFVNMTHAWSVETDVLYTSYNPTDLAKMWVGIYDYLTTNQANSGWAWNAFSTNSFITVREALGYKCTMFAKSGWITNVHDEGCVVWDGDHPYLMAIMSTADNSESWKMANLQRALDQAHQELVW